VLANEASKDSRPSSSGNLKTIDGKSVKTDSITTKASMADLALVPLESLKTLKNLAVKVDKEIDGKVYEATEFYTITGFTHMASVNLLSLHTSRGDTLIVDNGQVTVLAKDGTVRPVKAKRRRSLLAKPDDDDGFSCQLSTGDDMNMPPPPDNYGQPNFGTDFYGSLMNSYVPDFKREDSDSDSDWKSSDDEEWHPGDIPPEFANCFERGPDGEPDPQTPREAMCENRGYDKNKCLDHSRTQGCCHFNASDGQCWWGPDSNVFISTN
jgi:hypothetical protein